MVNHVPDTVNGLLQAKRKTKILHSCFRFLIFFIFIYIVIFHIISILYLLPLTKSKCRNRRRPNSKDQTQVCKIAGFKTWNKFYITCILCMRTRKHNASWALRSQLAFGLVALANTLLLPVNELLFHVRLMTIVNTWMYYSCFKDHIGADRLHL